MTALRIVQLLLSLLGLFLVIKLSVIMWNWGIWQGALGLH